MAWLLLILGVALWAGAHFFKRMAPARRAAMGDKGKGLVAGALAVSILLMILGYRWTPFVTVWSPPAFLTHANNLLVLIAFYLMSPAPKKGALFYRMRHPQLTGFGLWALAHLLVNGDLASIVLFGGLWLWSLGSKVIINRAEPLWTPNPKGAIKWDLIGLAASVVLVGLIGWIHTLFGLVPFGG